jgi:hypothetical protein
MEGTMLNQDEIDRLTAGYVDEEDRGSRGGSMIVLAAAMTLLLPIAVLILYWPK